MRAGALVLVLAALFIASCGGGEQGVAASAAPVLQYQPAGEELRLGTLQVGQDVYPDVALRLAPDGNWALKSVGTLRPLQPNESPQAVLQAGEGTTLAPGWRPSVATITVRRLHIGSKVYGNVPLQLAGGNWFWGSARQAGDDTRDLHELKALSLADFQANPALAATDTHHTVLHSSPERRRQGFPMQLEAKRYRFCMDAQEQGADRVRLLDAGGTAVVTLKAGDACVEAPLAAGRYTVEHEYGGSGAARAIFVRPFVASVPAVQRVAAGSAAALTEYWKIYLPASWHHGDGFLSFNAVNPPQAACKGFIDAAGRLTQFGRTGDLTSFSPLDGKNFFRVYRGANGAPTDLGGPQLCDHAGWGMSFWNDTEEGAGPLLLAPSGYYLRNSMSTVPIKGYSHGNFRLGYVYYCGVYPDNCWAEADFGFSDGTTMAAVTEADIWDITRNWYPFNGLSASHPETFRVAFRYLPEGLPPAMRDAYGTWLLEQGEVAFFVNAGCTGAALVARHEGTLAPQSAKSSLGHLFSGSLQLGPNAVLTATRGGAARGITQSGCLQGAADLSQDAIEITTTTQIDIHTNSCEFCNLAGIDLSGRDAGLQGVKLQHTNLADARLQNSDLSGADLRFATLQGANLSRSNLERANLCRTVLNGRSMPSGASGAAATLSGAHLKNANLDGANLDGADFTSASVYSSRKGACIQAACEAGGVPQCASAVGASVNNTTFVKAYLANADLSGVAGTSADFSQAILFGARLVGARLGQLSTQGKATRFNAALLHGTDFTRAQLQYVSFVGAAIDGDTAIGCREINLTSDTLRFPGFTVPGGGNSCVVPAAPAAQTCVRVSYDSGQSQPATDDTNLCPLGNNGPCSWPADQPAPTTTCTATPPLCGGDAFHPGSENTCWNQ